MGRNYLTKITINQQNMSFFNTGFTPFNMFDDYAPVRKQDTRCCNDPYCERNYAKNNVRRAPQQRRDPFDTMFDSSFNKFGNNFNNSSFYDNGFNSQFFDDEYDTSYPNRRVRTARNQPRNAPKTAKKAYYKPQEDLRRSTFIPNENQENVDPNFSQNGPKPTPKYYSSSFQSNTVNRNGNKTTINKKKYRDNDNSETSITKIIEDKDGNRRVQKINPENYSDELKAIMNSMEETGAVLMEIPSDENKSDNESVKMLEENDNSKRSFSTDKISNTESGNNLF